MGLPPRPCMRPRPTPSLGLGTREIKPDGLCRPQSLTPMGLSAFVLGSLPTFSLSPAFPWLVGAGPVPDCRTSEAQVPPAGERLPAHHRTREEGQWAGGALQGPSPLRKAKDGPAPRSLLCPHRTRRKRGQGLLGGTQSTSTKKRRVGGAWWLSPLGVPTQFRLRS